MDIGMLNRCITFQKQETAADDVGNHIDTWTDYYSCAATVSGESGNETFAAGEINEHPDLCVTVRCCRKAAAVTSTGYRIVFDEEIYDVIGIDHFGYKMEALKFKCRKVKR